jgi:hypothetical protein
MTELLPSLPINQSRYMIGKGPLRRVAAGIGSERINLNHPTAAKAKDPIQAAAIAAISAWVAD